MRFEIAAAWLLVPPLLGYVYWLSRRSYAHLLPSARRASLALRSLVLIGLAAALSQPSWKRASNAGHLIFIIDASQSVSAENLDAALDDVDRLAAEALSGPNPPRVSLIAFGRTAALLRSSESEWKGWPSDLREKLAYARTLPDLYQQRTRLASAGTNGPTSEIAALEQRIAEVEAFRDDVAGDRSNLEAALNLAVNCGAGHEQRTLYLFTDGQFNRGQWQRAAGTLASSAAVLHTVKLDRSPPPEVAAADLSVPSSVRVDEGFTAELRVVSSVETAAELRIFKDGFVQEQREVSLRPGDNVFKLGTLHFREKGFHTVEAALRPRQDTQIRNNRLRALVVVPGEARVLYVDGNVDQIPYLKSALELEGLQVEARSAAGVPQSLSELLSFDAFVLCDVPAEKLSIRQMQMIRTYVQDFGGGFLMLGGDESFGLGGYYNTPIEEILPVRMPIQKDLLRPSLALALVIDKSGSMSGVKIELAKRAAIATAEAINPRDLITVVGFDGEARVILELTPAGDRASIASHIEMLDAGGGTFLYPALQEAHHRLVSSNARRKHIIILSDGQTQGFGYEELVQTIASDGISSSAVGIGQDADMRLMEQIALSGGGRAYFTNDFHSIPQIFTREALRASKSMLVERFTQPAAIADDPALEEIDTDELPALTGYVATTPKPAGSVLIVAETGDPILAKWRYGLGRTAAFTSEPKPRWAEDWIEWPDFAKFWSQLVRSVSGGGWEQGPSIECTHRLDDDGAVLTADVRDAEGNFVSGAALELAATDARGATQALPVLARGPGLFEARQPAVVYGRDQTFTWRIRGADGEPANGGPTPYGFVCSFSPEFATLGVNEEFVQQIGARGFGEISPVGQARLVLNSHESSRWIALWPYLLGLALFAIPFDILMRRLG